MEEVIEILLLWRQTRRHLVRVPRRTGHIHGRSPVSRRDVPLRRTGSPEEWLLPINQVSLDPAAIWYPSPRRDGELSPRPEQDVGR